MHLLAPAALWFLLPVIAALLLSRRTSAPVRQLVGNLYLWARHSTSDPVILAARRVRRHWLLVLQAAFMLAMVTALARPVLHWSPPIVAFVVDVSASMGAEDEGGTRLESLRKECRAAIEKLPWRARVRLIRAGAVAEDLGEYSRRDAQLIAAIDSLRLTGGIADLNGALNLARLALGDTATAVVFTDHGPDTPIDDTTQWVTVGRPVANVAVTSLAVRRSANLPRDGEALIAISNFSTETLEVPTELLMKDRVVARAVASVAAGATTFLTIPVRNIEGIIRARIQRRDGLSIDNERVTVVPSLRPVRVLLVGGQSTFLERALATHPNVALERAARGAIDARQEEFDVVVCDPCDGKLPKAAGVLRVVRDGELRPPEAVTVTAADHPLAASLDLGGVFAPAVTGPAAPGAVVVLRAGGVPAFIASEHEGARLAELRLDLNDPSLTMTTAFPALVGNAIEWLSTKASALEVTAGMPIELHVAKSGGNVVIRRPDGTEAQASRRGGLVTTVDTGTVGVYTTSSGEAIAVNAATAAESDLGGPVTRATLDGGRLVADGTPGAREEVTWQLLTLALALLFVEWWYRWRSPVRG